MAEAQGTVGSAAPFSYMRAEHKLYVALAAVFVSCLLLGDVLGGKFWKALTRSTHLWLRATGSTLLSQIVDTVMINMIFWLWTASADPHSFLGLKSPSERHAWIFAKIGREYLITVLVAILLTPVVYGLHGAIVRWLGVQPEAHERRG